MFWFGKKKNKSNEADGTKEKDNLPVSEDEDVDEYDDDYTEMADTDKDGSCDLSDDDAVGGVDAAAELQVTKTVTDFDELCEYVNHKPVGCIQYMRKENKEVFQLREVHLRLAGIWGSVSMAREYSERDYAKIMLALELLEKPEEFYVLPMFTESEMQSAIMTFCQENFHENGKKYVKNTTKFAKLISDNDCADEWYEYTDSLMHLKLERFCEKNGIAFDCADNGDNTDGE